MMDIEKEAKNMAEFRKMRRFRQQITDEECYELLRQEGRGILAVNGENGYPYCFPINFYFDEKSMSLYFHCAKSGYKLDCLQKDSRACFSFYDQGHNHGGRWQKHFKSMIIFGTIEFIDDPDKSMEYMRKFDLKFETPEETEKHLKREGHLTQVLVLKIDHMTGKRVLEG